MYTRECTNQPRDKKILAKTFEVLPMGAYRRKLFQPVKQQYKIIKKNKGATVYYERNNE